MKINFLLTVFLSTIFLTLACENNRVGDSENISEGELIYNKHCVICHGKDGQLGAAKAKNLATSTLSLEESMQAIRQGSPQMGMPAYEKRLDVMQIKALTIHIKSLRVKK